MQITDNSFFRNNTAKVNKIIATILWLTLVAFCFVIGSKQVELAVVLSLFVELSIATFLMYRKKKPVMTWLC